MDNSQIAGTSGWTCEMWPWRKGTKAAREIEVTPNMLEFMRYLRNDFAFEKVVKEIIVGVVGELDLLKITEQLGNVFTSPRGTWILRMRNKSKTMKLISSLHYFKFNFVVYHVEGIITLRTIRQLHLPKHAARLQFRSTIDLQGILQLDIIEEKVDMEDIIAESILDILDDKYAHYKKTKLVQPACHSVLGNL
ncbi:hypothetical protein C5167_009658 [Papaver somniferum]|uniref:Uncharacterized protein n=1 Tax=Papaver somniferum TaxID=3469 RepID=A0A4Y7JY00_PAPSO|nr:hypothetical protein C5167_009658 [Papaver somniferum]